MYVALNSTLTAGRVPWPEFAHLAARLGFGGVDVDTHKAMSEGIDSTRALLSELKIKPAMVDLPVEFRKDDATFRQDLKKLANAAHFAAAIGCPRMATWVMPSSETPKAELVQTYRRRFAACAEILAPHKVRLGLEFIGPLHLRKMFPHEFIWRMDEMVAFAAECGPNVGVLLDSWHWHHAGGTLKDIVSAGTAGRIVCVQVADSPNLPPEKIRDDERLLPGEGVIDLVGFFKALRDGGYKDGISPEVFGRGLKKMAPEEGARMGLRTTLDVMRRAGVA